MNKIILCLTVIIIWLGPSIFAESALSKTPLSEPIQDHGKSNGQIKTNTFFSSTQYPLTVYFLKGPQPGPTILVQGGIQGDEPSGFLTAQLLSRSRVKKGRLIVIPRANVPSILAFKRAVNVDMNRRFDNDYNKFYEDRLVRADRILLSGCAGLIHLHEGSGFYNPKYIDQARNPKRYGQSLIIDTAIFGQQIKLAQAATQVINEVNPFVLPTTYRFRLFNTNTFSPTTLYPEQRKSFTFYALSKKHIPALAIEVSKYINDLNWKIRHHLLAAQKALQRFGVIVQPPKVPYISPGSIITAADQKNFQLKVNDKVCPPGKTVVLNWQTGLSLFHKNSKSALDPVWGLFLDNCPLNLLRCQGIPKTNAKQLLLKADGQLLARWPIRWKATGQTRATHLICLLNNRPLFLAPGQPLLAQEGDQLIVLGLKGGSRQEILNLKGYISQPDRNTGQDLGYEIILDKHAFLDAYLHHSPFGWSTEIIRETPGQKKMRFPLQVSRTCCYTLQLSKANGETISIPCQSGKIRLAPGLYSLQGTIGTKTNKQLTVLLDQSPVPWGEKFALPAKAMRSLQLCLETTLAPIAKIKISSF